MATRQLRATLVTLTVFTALTVPAMAAPRRASSVNARLSALEAQLKAQSAQIAAQSEIIRQQQAALEAMRADITVPQSPSLATAKPESIGTTVGRVLAANDEAAATAVDRPKLGMSGGRPTFSTADGRFSLSLRGLAQLDTGFYRQRGARAQGFDFRRGSAGSLPNRENSAAGDLSSGANFRRARIGFEGTFDRSFTYKLMLELGGSGTEGPARINDAWLAWNGFAPFTVQLGAFAPPANMDDGTSPEDHPFLERASAAELSRAMAGADGRVGLALKGLGKNWMASLAVTGPTVNDAETNDEQLGFVGRGSWLVVSAPDNDYAIQLDASGSYISQLPDVGLVNAGGTALAYNASRTPFRLRDRPELRLDSTRLIDTGPINAASAWVAGVGAAAQWHNLLIQGEHFWFGVRRRDWALDNPRFSGGYVQALWTLTGERRRQNMASGSFQAPRPGRNFNPATGGWGALELAARYSWVDLDYHAGLPGFAPPADGIRGGTQKIWTVGLNWYLNSNVRLMFDYQRINVDRLNPASAASPTPFGISPSTPPVGAQIGQKFDTLSIRSQFAF